MHGLFALARLLPEAAKDLGELATFAIDDTFWLNLLALMVAAAMFLLSRTNTSAQASSENHAQGAGR